MTTQTEQARVTQADRTPIELVMFAAWLGVDPQNIPPQYRSHSCADTMARWHRVGEAAVAYARLAAIEEAAGDEAAATTADEVNALVTSYAGQFSEADQTTLSGVAMNRIAELAEAK